MVDFVALKAADAALGSLSVAAAAAALSAQTVTAAPRDIAWSAIRDVLMNNFDWGTLELVANTAPLGALPGGGVQTLQLQADACAIRSCCLWGGTFNSANATVWGRLTAAATRLSATAVGAITSASGVAVTALRTPTVAVWPGGVTAGDVQTARAQP